MTGNGSLAEDVPGQTEAIIDGTTYRLGDLVLLHLTARADPYDRILDGRRATVERIFLDYDDKLYVGMTIDDDPGQQLMRDTGRFLFFFAGEFEPWRAS